MWERIPVGRPRKLPSSGWDYSLEDDGDPWRFPTVAYSWDTVEAYTDNSMGRYKSYTNELDTLTYDLVTYLNIKPMCDMRPFQSVFIVATCCR